MNLMQTLQFSPEDINVLRGRLLEHEPVFPLLQDPNLSAQIVALGIRQEVGTVNDEFAGFIFDLDTGLMVDRGRLRAEVIEYRGFVGVRIWAEGHDRLDLRLRGARALLHAPLSLNPDGSVRQVVFFPESIAKIARLQGAELVLVREWALNTIFGGFDRSLPFYQVNVWELVHNDSLRYAGLLEKKQVTFLGTHDLTSHVAGLSGVALAELQVLGAETRRALEEYLGPRKAKAPPIYSLVLPYAAGVLLDDLAQPMNYAAPGRRYVFNAIMEVIRSRVIVPAESKILLRFPPSYEKLIELARLPNLEEIKRKTASTLAALIQELRINTADLTSSSPSVVARSA